MFSVIFPGQGSQIVGKGKDLYEKFDIVKNYFKEADETLGISLSSIILKGSKEELDLTINTQPAIFLISYSIFNVIKKEFNLDLKDGFDLIDIHNRITQAFNNNKKLIFIFNLIDVNIISMDLLMKLIPLLKKHKANIKEKLVKSIIKTNKKWHVKLLNMFFLIYKPEKPVHFIKI